MPTGKMKGRKDWRLFRGRLLNENKEIWFPSLLTEISAVLSLQTRKSLAPSGDFVQVFRM